MTKTKAPEPSDEAQRLETLRAYSILDTPSEPAFERIVSLVERVFRVPVCAISLVNQDRLWFKARRGLASGEAARKISFCTHAILGDKVLVVPDASKDPRFSNHPVVTGDPGYSFYAGAPLRVPEGHRLGTLCIMDRRPRELDEAECRTLTDFAALVVDELVLRRTGSVLRAVLAGGLKDVPEDLLHTPEGMGVMHTRKPPLFNADGKVRHPLGVSHQVTERLRHEKQLVERARQQAAVADLSRRALELGEAGLDPFLVEAARLAAETLGADYSSVFEHVPHRGVLIRRAGCGWPSESVGSEETGAPPRWPARRATPCSPDIPR